MTRRLLFFFVGLSLMLGLGFSSLSAQAQSNNTWQAQYFNNTSFSGSPTATATLNNLNVNWGNNAPATGVGADNWTARFNTVSYFNSGTYRFTVNADDAFRLYVHGKLLLDTINNPKPNQTFTVDMNLTAGNGGVQIEYREYVGAAFLYVSWQQVTGTTNPTPQPQQPVSGMWTAHYFNNTNLTGSPVATGSFNSLNLNWGNNSPANGVGADNWTARFTTSIYFNAGSYRFNVHADDAFRLIVANQVLLDTFPNPQPDKYLSADVYLPAGNVYLQVDFREYIGPAFLNLSWAQISGTGQQPQPNVPVGTAQLTIVTGSLNVRSTPFIGDNVILQVYKGSSYPIIGKNSAGDWYQIKVGQTVGWVSSHYVSASNTNSVPVVTTQVSAPNVPTTPTAWSLTANANVNIRSGAGLNYSKLSILPYKATASIVGRNSNNTWYLISYAGVTGWVSGDFVILPWNINYSQIPVR